jgi:hypothetical protein
VSSFTRDPKRDFGVYAKGYRMAADQLASALLNAPRFSDYEAYPVVFLYRHALELSLKHIVYSAATLAKYTFTEDVEDSLKNWHNLEGLAQVAEDSIFKVVPGDRSLKELFLEIAKTCRDFSTLDPDSYSFRYPIKRDGKPSTKPHLVVNLTDYAGHLSRLLEVIESTHFALDGEIYIAQDVFSEKIINGLAQYP